MGATVNPLDSTDEVRAHLLLTERVYEEDGQWVSECEESGIASSGVSVPEALAAFDGPIQVYLEALNDAGDLKRVKSHQRVRIILDREDAQYPERRRQADLVTERSASPNRRC